MLVAAWLYALAGLAFLFSRGSSALQAPRLAAARLAAKDGALAKWSRRAGVATFMTALAFHAAGLAARAYIAQRAPVASFYETIVFMSGAACLFALIFELVKGGSVTGLWGSALGVVALLLGNSIPAYVETQAIEPLEPVLRSYWLNIHVTCMLSSYGALALAFGVGLDYGATYLFYKGPDRDERLARMDDFNYRVIQVGFLLITTGTGLGAVWANQSWGRYWGWDPKETGAFITWLIYAGYLHARFMGWVKGIWSTVWNVCGFMGVIFTYVVVSFFLKGLHSYLQ
jgi:cytochrome c-type biogenesis protein CcsB